MACRHALSRHRGKPPPQAFDRMLEDGYEPLAGLARGPVAQGTLAAIDAALAVRAPTGRSRSASGARS